MAVDGFANDNTQQLASLEKLLQLAPLTTLCDAQYRDSSTYAASSVRQEVRRRIMHHLQREFSFPEDLLLAMKNHGAILCGEFPLSLVAPFGRSAYEIIEIAVGHNEFWEMVEYLEIREHAKVESFHVRFETLGADAFTYAVEMRSAQSDCPIRILRSSTPSALSVVPHFCSTHLMNIITPSTLIIPYPSLTFASRAVPIGRPPANQTSAFDGFRVDSSFFPGSHLRTFTDDASIQVTFNSDHLPVSTVDDSNSISWQLQQRTENGNLTVQLLC